MYKLKALLAAYLNLNNLQKLLFLKILSQGWQAFRSCNQIQKCNIYGLQFKIFI